MADVNIVPFKPDDLDQMMEIEVRVFATPWSRQSYEELYPLDTIQIWVAKIDDEIVGYLLYQFFGDEMELHSIAVKPEFQNRGIGALLMEHVLVRASLLGISRIYLLVRPSNEAAKRLYARFGFNVVGVRRNYYWDNSENALIMCREGSLNGKNK